MTLLTNKWHCDQNEQLACTNLFQFDSDSFELSLQCVSWNQPQIKFVKERSDGPGGVQTQPNHQQTLCLVCWLVCVKTVMEQAACTVIDGLQWILVPRINTAGRCPITFCLCGSDHRQQGYMSCNKQGYLVIFIDSSCCFYHHQCPMFVSLS